MTDIVSGLLVGVAANALSQVARPVAKALRGSESNFIDEHELASLRSRLPGLLSAMREHATLDQAVIDAWMAVTATWQFELVSRRYAVAMLTNQMDRFEQPLSRQLQVVFTSGARDMDGGALADAVKVIDRWMRRTLRELLDRLASTRSDAFERLVSSAHGQLNSGALAGLDRGFDQLDPATQEQFESFATVYRRQLRTHTSMLAAANIEKQLRIPIDDLYVAPDFYAYPRPSGRWSSSQLLPTIHRAVVVGDPGAGKSTLCQKLMYDLSDPSVPPRDARLPFTFVLRDFQAAKVANPSMNFPLFFENTCRADLHLDCPPGALEYFLQAGKALIVFDGLDELKIPTSRKKVVGSIESFAHLYPDTPVLVTSREIGYLEAPLREDAFNAFRLAPLDTPNVRQYVRNWFHYGRDPGGLSLDRTVEAFMAETDSAQDIRVNPLMLGLLCTLYKGYRHVPKNRADLYQRCAALLFDQWDSSRDLSDASPLALDVRGALHEIAHWVFTNQYSNSQISESRLRERLVKYWLTTRYEDEGSARAAAEELLGMWRGRAWILVDAGLIDGENYFKFSHRTFMEFFAAEGLQIKYRLMDALWPQLHALIRAESSSVVPAIALQSRRVWAPETFDEVYELMTAALVDRKTLREGVSIATFGTAHLTILPPHRAIARPFIEQIVRLASEAMPAWVEMPSYTEFSVYFAVRHEADIEYFSAEREQEDYDDDAFSARRTLIAMKSTSGTVQYRALIDRMHASPEEMLLPLLDLLRDDGVDAEEAVNTAVAALETGWENEAPRHADYFLASLCLLAMTESEHTSRGLVALRERVQAAHSRFFALAGESFAISVLCLKENFLTPLEVVAVWGAEPLFCGIVPLAGLSSRVPLRSAASLLLEDLLNGDSAPGRHRELLEAIADLVPGDAEGRRKPLIDREWLGSPPNLIGSRVRRLDLLSPNADNDGRSTTSDNLEACISACGSSRAVLGAWLLLAVQSEVEPNWFAFDHSEDQVPEVDLGQLTALAPSILGRAAGRDAPPGLKSQVPAEWDRATRNLVQRWSLGVSDVTFSE